MRSSIFISDNVKSSSTVMFVLVLLLSFWFYSGTPSVEDTVLKVEITKNAEVILDGKLVALHDLQLTANNLMDKYEDLGVNREQVMISLHADKSLNLGVVFDVQEKLKSCGLKKLSYAD
jgi:biopolymer transport protein ExbD